jgi:hypothetical protein
LAINASASSLTRHCVPWVHQNFTSTLSVLRCHPANSLVRNDAMEPTDAEKQQARRVQRLLYALVGFMIVVPVIIYFLRLP